MTIPNILTLFRIFLTPLLIWLLLVHRFPESLLVFIVAGVTDGLDGLIARLFHQKSKLGAYLDPVADKLLLVSSFLLLGYLEYFPVWLVVIVVSRDVIIILGIASLSFHHVPVEIKPSILSKLNTLFQLFMVFITLLKCSSLIIFPQWGSVALAAIVSILCLITAGQYVARGIRIWEVNRGSQE
jgi:cardiolipin synthase